MIDFINMEKLIIMILPSSKFMNTGEICDLHKCQKQLSNLTLQLTF